MKRAATKKNSVYRFLDESGVLESGNGDAITEARKEYWREYKATWRRAKRQEEKELTCSWKKDELKMLSEAAKKHTMSKTQFMKRATLAYINTSYIAPDTQAVRNIIQYLEMTYNSIQEMFDENALPLHTGTTILEKMADLERDVHLSLHNPKTLEQLITDTIRNNPQEREALFHLLETIP